MIRYKEFDIDINCIKDESISYNLIGNIYSEYTDRDSRIIKLDFEGDIAQFVIKNNSYLIKLYPIASIFISENPVRLIILNTDNIEVHEYFNYFINNKNKVGKLNINSFIENLLTFHSENIDKKIKSIANQIGVFNLDNIESKNLAIISKLFHELLLLKNQYDEIQQTLTQINELSSEKLKINNTHQLEEFTRTINIYQNQFEEDVKTMNRMAKEIEILIQMTDIKFADKRNNIAITSLKIDIIILIISFISMFGSIFGMNLDSSLEDIQYGLYFILILIFMISFFLFKFIKNYLFNSIKI
tara:strand:+ start:5772 stop:6674 length:903 start_codon:yes stop_codon:yes gene_type:complete